MAGSITNGLNQIIASFRVHAATREDLVKIHLQQAVAEPAAQIASTIQEAARGAGSVLAKAASAKGQDLRRTAGAV